jgi:hypothetical protein
VAGQLVDKAPETTWRNPPEISEPDQDEGTAFTQAWTDLANRLGVWGVFEEADSKARIDRYSVIVIGTAGTDAALERPLSKLSGPDAVLYLSAFHNHHAQIEEWDTNPATEHYGMPLIYNIDLAGDVQEFRKGRTITQQKVHWTRCIHVSEGRVFGRPVLKRVWNYIHDLQKISTSTGEAFWQRVAGILAAKLPSGKDDIQPTPNELRALDEVLQQLYHDMKRTVYTNAELYRVADSEPDPHAAADLYMTLIAAGATPPMPKRVLFGSETGERASSEDQKNWLGSISERHEQHAEPRMLRPLIDRLISFGALPRPGRQGYDVVWPTLYSVPEIEVAEANLKRAQSISAVTPMGGDPTLLYEIDEDRNIWPIPRKAEDPSPFEGMEPPDDGDEPPVATEDE